MNIKVTKEYNMYWALDDDTYDGPESYIGRGSSELEAINDLVEHEIDRLETHIDALRLENRALRAELSGKPISTTGAPPV